MASTFVGYCSRRVGRGKQPTGRRRILKEANGIAILYHLNNYSHVAIKGMIIDNARLTLILKDNDGPIQQRRDWHGGKISSLVGLLSWALHLYNS